MPQPFLFTVWVIGQQTRAGLDLPRKDTFKLFAFTRAFLRHVMAQDSLGAHYRRSQIPSSSSMDGTRLYFPALLIVRGLHKKWANRPEEGGGMCLFPAGPVQLCIRHIATTCSKLWWAEQGSHRTPESQASRVLLEARSSL